MQRANLWTPGYLHRLRRSEVHAVKRGAIGWRRQTESCRDWQKGESLAPHGMTRCWWFISQTNFLCKFMKKHPHGCLYKNWWIKMKTPDFNKSGIALKGHKAKSKSRHPLPGQRREQWGCWSVRGNPSPQMKNESEIWDCRQGCSLPSGFLSLPTGRSDSSRFPLPSIRTEGVEKSPECAAQDIWSEASCLLEWTRRL